MFARIVRWILIAAPVVAGILLLILGTAGAISTTFGVVLIGLGPIIWMWNWFIRMSFDDYDRREEERQVAQRTHDEQVKRQRLHKSSPPSHTPPRRSNRPPRRPE